MKLLFACIFACTLSAIPASAENGAPPDNLPKVNATLLPERTGVAPGGQVTIALKEVIRKNWHTYWRNPGDAGAPTTITWHLPKGWTASAVQWPYPKRLPVAQLMDFGYEGQVALLTDISVPRDAQPGATAQISADVNWLVCSDVCVPEGDHLSLSLPVVAVEPPADATVASLFASTRAHLPQKSTWPARYDASDNRFALLIEHAFAPRELPREASFYPYDDGMVEAAAPQRLEQNDSGIVLESAPGNKLASPQKRQTVRDISGLLVLTAASGAISSYELQAKPGPVVAAAPVSPPPSGSLSLAFALVSAVLGGLILNLMPCVFPVLSMKALALAAKPDDPHEARQEGLAYGAGAILSFVVLAGILLALRSAGAALGWGFQLQQPVFVATVALLMFVIGLNLSGLFEIRLAANPGNGLASRRGPIGSFFTGVLAVVVAAPCTAPFMAAATGYALAADAAWALAIFAALGAGFAAPFAALAFAPGLLRRIPRPGPWMLLLRRILAFPMYGAAIWLTWVLSLQAGPQGVLALLAAALLVAFALWFAGEQIIAGKVWVRRAAAGLAIAGAIVAVAGISSAPASGSDKTPGQLAYEPFTAARLAELQQAGRPVFVNATAAWCITCLVNERLALSAGDVAKAFADHKVAALRADWTNQDPAVTDLLVRQSRSGVPLYLYYPPHAATPVVLPQILTAATVVAAVNKGG